MARKLTIQLGTKFGHWMVLSYDKQHKKYLCECVCGTQSYVGVSGLKSGVSRSCGCRQKDSVGLRIQNDNFKSLKNKIYDNYKRAALKRGYSFELTWEVFEKLITDNCYYCGDSPNMTYKYGRGTQVIDYSKFKYNGVDRVDNSIGYNIINCVPCCKICNNSKGTLHLNEWKMWIDRINKFGKLR